MIAILNNCSEIESYNKYTVYISKNIRTENIKGTVYDYYKNKIIGTFEVPNLINIRCYEKIIVVTYKVPSEAKFP